jgi:2-keto-4-pentenoate hydratase
MPSRKQCENGLVSRPLQQFKDDIERPFREEPAPSNMGIEKRAARQLADYDARQPGMMFAEGVSMGVAEGYELQSAVADLRCRRGEQIIGYKVGCTAPKVRAQLGIDQCIMGRLYGSEKHESGGVLSRNEFASLAIEGELAVELAREPTPEDFSEGEIPACVSRVIPVIELHHFVMRCQQPSAGELIANNAIHGGIVVGHGIRPEEIRMAQNKPSLAIYVDSRLVEECEGDSLIQNINSSLKWLTETVRERGDRLGAGQLVLTGSIPSLIPIEADCRLRVEAPPFGDVETTITS